MTKNPTDTNQASEDELDEILKQSYKHIAYSFIATLPPELKYYYSKTAQTLDYEKEFNYTKAAIQSLLRTEKLKLLAEVRERVVGKDDKQVKNDEDFDDWLVCATCDVILSDETEPEYSCICTRRNDLRAEQRDNLTQLEAEL